MSSGTDAICSDGPDWTLAPTKGTPLIDGLQSSVCGSREAEVCLELGGSRGGKLKSTVRGSLAVFVFKRGKNRKGRGCGLKGKVGFLFLFFNFVALQ